MEILRKILLIILSLFLIIVGIIFVSCGGITYFTQGWGGEGGGIFGAGMVLGLILILWGIRNWYNTNKKNSIVGKK